MAIVNSVMLRFRREPLKKEGVDQAVSVLEKLHGGADDEQLQAELFEMITLLQLRLREEAF